MEQVIKDKTVAAGMQEVLEHAWHMKPETGENLDEDSDPDEDAALANMRAKRVAEMKKRSAERAEMKATGTESSRRSLRRNSSRRSLLRTSSSAISTTRNLSDAKSWTCTSPSSR